MENKKVVICPKCKAEIQVRSNFAHDTLNNHLTKCKWWGRGCE